MGKSIDPPDSGMTLAQFQALSSEERKAMPIRESGRFYAMEAVQNLRAKTAEAPPQHPTTER